MTTNPPNAAKGKRLPPAALRALREAHERQATPDTKPIPNESAGPKGAEPTRFGDWERGGITYDF